MKNSLKKLSDSKVEILFELAWQELSPYLEKAAQELSRDLKFKGFREGKAPREFVEKEFGEGKVLAQAAELAVKDNYPKFVSEKKLEVIAPPQVEILKLAKDNPFSFRVKVDVLPEIKLPDYKKIASETSQKEVSVEDKEVNQALNWLRKSKSEFKDLAREAQKGDFLEIKYQSPQLEGGKVFEDSFEMAKGHFVPGFEENLQGMKKGEEKEFTVPFPKDYLQKELAGKQVNFKVKVKRVSQAIFPEINDDFARSLGKFENLDNLKKNIKEGISQEKEMAEKGRRRGEILEKIAERTEFEVPPSLVSLETERMLNDLKNKVAKELKIPFQDYLSKVKKRSEEELKKSLIEQAKKKVKNFLLLRQIGKKEEVKVSQEEVEAAVNGFLQNYPAEQDKKEVDPERLKEYYRGVIYNEKVFQKLEKI